MMGCYDNNLGICSKCGSPLLNGYVWHGKKWTWLEWVERYGAVCCYCQARKELNAKYEAERLEREKRRFKGRKK